MARKAPGALRCAMPKRPRLSQEDIARLRAERGARSSELERAHALLGAARAGDVEEVGRALAAGGNPGAMEASGRNALMVAAGMGFAACVERLAPVSDWSARDDMGLDAWLLACEASAEPAMRALADWAGKGVEAGSVPASWARSVDKYGRGACVLVSNVEALRLALDAGAQANSEEQAEGGERVVASFEPLGAAARDGDAERVAELLSRGADPKRVDAGGMVSLARAADAGSGAEAAARLLIKAWPEGGRFAGPRGWSPLMWALASQSCEIAKELVPLSDAGAKNADGRTALGCAAMTRGAEEVVGMLLEGEGLWAVDHCGMAPLALAGLAGNLEADRILAGEMRARDPWRAAREFSRVEGALRAALVLEDGGDSCVGWGPSVGSGASWTRWGG